MTPRSQIAEHSDVAGADAASPPAGDPPERTVGSSLVRLTINLTDRSHQVLLALSGRTGTSKTEVVNRSILLYGLINELLDRGGGQLTVIHKDGQRDRIYIL